MAKNLSKIFNSLESHYNDLFKKYGDNVKSSQQINNKTRNIRFFHLIKGIHFDKNDKVLDFGCGTGFLYNYIKKYCKFKGYYTGYDIASEIIKFNKKKFKKNKRVNFKKINILKDGLKEKFDYIIINGTFNNKTKKNWLWMQKILLKLYPNTKKILIFNNLSSYVDYKNKSLFYINPEKVFKFCKINLSKQVILDHGYKIKKNILPYEFTIKVFKK